MGEQADINRYRRIALTAAQRVALGEQRRAATNAYWQALGRFVETFAFAEDALFNYVAWQAGIEHRAAIALLAGARTEVLIDNVRRLWHVTAPTAEVKEELEDVLGRMKFISGVRNSVIHYTSSGVSVFDLDERISANTNRALTPDAHKVHKVSAAILIEHCLDLLKIYDHLYSLAEHPVVPKAERGKAWPGVLESWRYTILTNPNQKPRKARRPKGKPQRGNPAPPEASLE